MPTLCYQNCCKVDHYEYYNKFDRQVQLQKEVDLLAPLYLVQIDKMIDFIDILFNRLYREWPYEN